MTLKDLIVQYRKNQHLSQRQFAAKCGLSNGYISMLEKGVNPHTELPLTPTLPKLKQLANGMDITLTALLTMVDDMPVSLLQISSDSDDILEQLKCALAEENNQIAEILHLVLSFSPEKQSQLLEYAQFLAGRK